MNEPPTVTPDGPARLLALESVFNVRDLGGYRVPGGHVRWRRLLRADGLHRCSPDDVERLAALVHTVIDLRSTAEVEKHGSFPLDRIAGRYHHLPVIDTTWEGRELDVDVPAPEFLCRRYLEMLEEGRDAYAQALRVLADPLTYPVVFHCAAGKDRTGVLAALVLSLLGVPDDVIAEDYGHSRDAMRRFKERLLAEEPELRERIDASPQVFFDAPPAAMRALLDEVRARHGSVHGYVTAIGLDDHTVASIRHNLLVTDA